MYRILIFAFAIMTTIACSNESKTSTSSVETTEQTQTATRQGTPFPSITEEWMNKLATQCDHLDYTFLELPFSMSANEGAAKGSVMSFLRHISVTPAIVLNDCPTVAKIYYQIKGEIVMEADFHFFRDECRYFVFYEDGKPKYANYLTAEAAGYYEQIFSSVTKQQ